MTQQSEKSERVKFASQLPPDLLKSMKAAAKADGKLQFSFNATDSAFEIVPQTFTWELASTDNIAIVQQNFLERRERPRPRRHVLDALEVSMAEHAALYQALAK